MDPCAGIVASRRLLITQLWMVLIAAPLFFSSAVFAKEEHRKPVMVWTMAGGGYPGDFNSAEEAFAALNQGLAEDYAACSAGQCGVCNLTVFETPTFFSGPVINGEATRHTPTRATRTSFWPACPISGTPAQGPVSVPWTGDGTDIGWSVSGNPKCPQGFVAVNSNHHQVTLSGGTAQAYDVSCMRWVPDPPKCPENCDRLNLPPELSNPQYGNPVDAVTATKVDLEYDYVAGDGLLSVRRSYSSGAGRWYWNHAAGLVDLTGRSTASARSTDYISTIKMIVDGPHHGTPPPPVDVPKSFPLIKARPSLDPPAVWVMEDDGRRLVFAETSGAFSTLRSDRPQLTVAAVAGGHQWTLKRRGGRFDIFGADGQLVAQKFSDGKSVTFTRGATTLQVKSYPGGRQIEYARSNANLIPGVYDIVNLPGGSQIQYEINAQGIVTGVAYADSKSKHYLYEEPAYAPPPLIGDPQGGPRMTGLIDESNVRVGTYKYNNIYAASTEAANGVNKYSVSAYGNRTDIFTPPLGQREVIEFENGPDGERRITGRTIPGGSGYSWGAARVTYDAAGNVATLSDYRGNSTCYANDATRGVDTVRIEGVVGSCPANVASYTIPVNTRQRKISTQWHPGWNFPVKRAEPKKITTWVYNGEVDPSSGVAASCAAGAPTLPDGTVIAVVCKRIEQETTDATGTTGFSAVSIGAPRVWTYTYNHFGQILTADGPRTDVSDVASYTYYDCDTGYQCGRPATVTNALGHTTTYNTYNAHGMPLMITDANGLAAAFTYDLRQRLTSRTVGYEETSYSYYPTGLLRRVTLPDSSYIEYTYDPSHRLTEISDGEANRIKYTLDAGGNRTIEEVYDPSSVLASKLSRAFDANRRASQELGAAGTAAVTTGLQYDINGNRTQINAPLGRNTRQAFDELNRLTQVTDPMNGVTQYGYNALDQLTSVTDPRSKLTSYTYNAFGDLTGQVSPDTGTTNNTHDGAGNLLTSTDARNKTATLTHDVLNRPVSVSYPDQTITYTYDTGSNQKGRLTQVTDNSGSTSWSYDAHGRVLFKQQSMGINRSVGYAYDAGGRLQTLTLPSGNTVTYGYTEGRITSLVLNGSTNILNNVLYQPFGPTRGWTWGNGTAAIHEYDDDGNVTLIDSAGLKTYSYDNAFRITSISDSANAALSQSFGYDLLDRLTSATGTSLNQSWTYDANGNRLTQSGSSSSTYAVSGTSNRLNSVTGALSRSYTYDNAGNVTSDGTSTFVYDDAGRMISATKAGVTATYVLNALGQRVKKTASGVSLYFVYDEAGHLLGEYDSTGALIQETIWFGDTPVATLRPGGSSVDLYYVHVDHLGTPRRVSRPADNVVVWRWDSDPFGVAAVNEDPDGDVALFVYNLRFPGQYHDREVGLNYNYYRDYDPTTGRYMEADPVGLLGGLNPYTYVASDPIRFVDPLGLWSIKFGVYAGRGGSMSFGFRNGDFFIRGGLGVGLGGGFKFYPDTEFPDSPNACGCSERAFMGASASIGATLGPAAWERKGEAGWIIYKDCEGKPHVEYIERIKPDYSLRGSSGWGLTLGGGINIVDLGMAL